MAKLVETGIIAIAKPAGEDIYNYCKKWFKKIDPSGKKSSAYIKALLPVCDSIQIMGM